MKNKLPIYKIVSFDLDGTLLNDKLKLTKVTKVGLSKIIKSGYTCIINTSRNLESTLSIIKDLQIPYLICLNGALIYDNINKKNIFIKAINKNIIYRLIKFLIKKQITANIFLKDSIYATGKVNGINKIYRESINPTVLSEKNINIICNSDVLNIELVINNNDSRTLLKSLINNFADYIKISEAGNNYYEITEKSIDKFRALKILLNKIKMKLKNVISVGDSMNDYLLIKKSGVGIAMKNSSLKVKSIADEITMYTNNNNGAIIHIIEKLSL
jgi:Cof subfamily protein (haloacid dehalogenase superfamily)